MRRQTGPTVHQLLPPVRVCTGDSGLAGINARGWGPALTALGHFPTFPSIPSPPCNSAVPSCLWFSKGAAHVSLGKSNPASSAVHAPVALLSVWGQGNTHQNLGVLRVTTGNKSRGSSRAVPTAPPRCCYLLYQEQQDSRDN